MSTGEARPRVTLQRRRLWSLRASLGITRWVLYAVALVGVIATARDAIAPPPERTIVSAPAPAGPDAGAEWFALSFARAYLSWSADPAVHQRNLAPFLTAAVDPDAGLAPSPGSSEQLRSLAIAGERDGPQGERDYTIAADTGATGIRYLVVAVAPASTGGYVLARYPALVAPPTAARTGALDGPGLPAVADPAAVAVLERVLHNYLTGSDENLAADLAPGAQVEPAAAALSVRSVARLAVEPSGTVLATVVAADQAGDVFTLAYEVGLRQLDGRWEVTRIAP
jgi:hypothetical protein